MKGLFLILCAIALLSSLYAKQYVETKEDIEKRLKFLNEKSQEITNGKILYKYTNEGGVFCETTQDIDPKEYVFSLNKNYIISFFDMFPFKFELRDAIIDYHSNGRPESFNNSTTSIVQNELFSFYLMFLAYENRDAVLDYVDSIGKIHYKVDIPKEYDEYLSHLPKVVYTVSEFNKPELILLELEGVQVNKDYEFTRPIAHVVEYIKKNHPKDAEMILPWVNNVEKFRYFLGIIFSRAYSTTFTNYEIIKHQRMLSQPMGAQHKKLIDSLSTNGAVSSLYAFIDNCNHKTTSKHPGKESLNFNTLAKDGELIVSIYNPIKKGEEYAYTYSPNLSNEHIVYRYGFFLKDNPNAQANININLMKSHFSKKKNDLCKELRCFDQYFDDFYNQNQMETATLLFTISRLEPAKRLMDAFRLYTFPENRLVRSEIIKRLSTGHWLNYESEIRAFAFFREAVINAIKSAKFSYEDLIYYIAETKKHFSENKELNTNPQMIYNYIVRTNILNLGKEIKNVYYTNLNYPQKKMRNTLNDQFRKLRNYFS